MKAAILTEDGFRIREVAVPTAGSDQVLVKTIACGICHGDVFQYQTRSGLGGAEVLLGHEGTGVVVAAAGAVQGFAEGDTVTAIGGT